MVPVTHTVQVGVAHVVLGVGGRHEHVPGPGGTEDHRRFAGYDAAVLMEVIEHIDPPRLTALEQDVSGPGDVRFCV